MTDIAWLRAIAAAIRVGAEQNIDPAETLGEIRHLLEARDAAYGHAAAVAEIVAAA